MSSPAVRPPTAYTTPASAVTPRCSRGVGPAATVQRRVTRSNESAFRARRRPRRRRPRPRSFRARPPRRPLPAGTACGGAHATRPLAARARLEDVHRRPRTRRGRSHAAAPTAIAWCTPIGRSGSRRHDRAPASTRPRAASYRRRLVKPPTTRSHSRPPPPTPRCGGAASALAPPTARRRHPRSPPARDRRRARPTSSHAGSTSSVSPSIARTTITAARLAADFATRAPDLSIDTYLPLGAEVAQCHTGRPDERRRAHRRLPPLRVPDPHTDLDQIDDERDGDRTPQAMAAGRSRGGAR